MAVDPLELRRCLGHFATGVTVVSYEVGGEPHGVTVNSFTSVSLDPPLVLVSLGRSTRSAGLMRRRPFTVNVLRASQDGLAYHFAGRPSTERVAWEPGPEGLAPRLTGALAHVACTPWQAVDAGDHILHLGEVRALESSDGEPLVFYRGAFRDLSPALGAALWLESLDSPSSLRFALASKTG